MIKKFLCPLILSAMFITCTPIAEMEPQNQSSPETVSSKARYFQEEMGSMPPLMGWASWNNYRVNINEEIIKMQTDALIDKKLNDYGYHYLNIDDGFYGGRDADGKIMVHKGRFPNGMKYMADYIRSKGLKPGLYSDAGANTCASFWDKDTIGSGMGLYGHEREDLNTYLKEWDYDFIKVDWCGGEWLGLNEEVRYTKIGNLIKEIKPSTNYNVCRWRFPGEWVVNLASSWRISSDIEAKFESILAIIDLNADLWKHASYGHYNDMDMLQVGRGMSYEEDKTHFTMWCLMHSPLLLGNDLTTMSDETKNIVTNKDLIAINQSKYVYQARRLVDYGELEVWGRPMAFTMSGKVVVVLLNRSKDTQDIEFKLESVGIDASKTYAARNLWSKETSEGLNDVTLKKNVPGHGVVVLEITGSALPFNVFQYDQKNE